MFELLTCPVCLHCSVLSRLIKLDHTSIGERARKGRRTIYTHEDWKKHRRQNRFFHNLSTLFSSNIIKTIRKYVFMVTCISSAICFWNGLVTGFMGIGASARYAPVLPNFPKIGLPLAPFSLAMPSLGLLLVFRTNTAYARWDEARKNWGLNINRTRDLMRMATAYHEGKDQDRRQSDLSRLALCTWAFVRSMKRHLSPQEEDAAEFEQELGEKLPTSQANGILRARHRPNRALQDLSSAIEALPVHFLRKDRLHSSLTQFEDNLGSSERLLSSPVPLFYTRHTTRFLAFFALLLPLALYDAFAGSWNAMAMIPATAVLSTCLFGIDELATQLEEPFTILPMQAFCDKIYDACTEIVEFDADPLLPRPMTTTPSSTPAAVGTDEAFVHAETSDHASDLITNSLLTSSTPSALQYDHFARHDDTLLSSNSTPNTVTSTPPLSSWGQRGSPGTTNSSGGSGARSKLFRRAVAKAAAQALH